MYKNLTIQFFPNITSQTAYTKYEDNSDIKSAATPNKIPITTLQHAQHFTQRHLGVNACATHGDSIGTADVDLQKTRYWNDVPL